MSLNYFVHIENREKPTSDFTVIRIDAYNTPKFTMTECCLLYCLKKIRTLGSIVDFIF